MSSAPFAGPLFLFGVARSGTKLLRSVVGALPDVGFPAREADCVLELLVELDGQTGASAERRMAASPYWIRKEQAPDLSWWPGPADAAARFERFCRHEGAVPPGGCWGDKSPAYIRRLPQLLERWPGARFVHIVRDTRDVCRSTRRAWGKSHERCAQHWVDRVAGALAWSEGRDDVLQVHYEQLVAEPTAVAERLAAFVGRPFDPAMLGADSGETVGLARGREGVVRTRQDDVLSAAEIARVEAIAGPLMEQLGYGPGGDGQRVPDRRLAWLRATDAVHMLRHRARRMGWAYTLRTSRPSR